MFSFLKLKKTPLDEEEAIDNFIVRIYLMLGMLFGALMGSAAGWYSAIPVGFILLIFVVVTLNDIRRSYNKTDEEIRAGIAADPDAAELTDEPLSQMIKRQPRTGNMHPDDETKTVLKCIHGNEAPDFSGCECRLMWRSHTDRLIQRVGPKEQE